MHKNIRDLNSYLPLKKEHSLVSFVFTPLQIVMRGQRVFRQLFVGTRPFSSSSSTVNPEEVSKFSKIGSEWWNSSSSHGTGPLHAMNPVRVSFVRQQLAERHDRLHLKPLQQIKGLSILDVGCGGGLLSEALARLGANMTSIDPSEENIAVARAHSSKSESTKGINYRVDRIENIAQTAEKFDAVCALEVIEHVENPAEFIQNCLRVLKPRGSLFVSTMNRSRKSYAMAILGAEYVLGLVPPGTHDWNKFVTPEELQVMIESPIPGVTASAKLVLHRGLVLDPSSQGGRLSDCIRWKLSDTDLDVNYISHAVVL